MLTFEQIDEPLFREITAELRDRPRMHGYYILHLVRVDPGWPTREEAYLDELFQSFDTEEWPPQEEREGMGGSWADYEVREDEARSEVIAALVGGGEIGHLKDTISARQPESVWSRFRSLFSPQVRFFMRLGLGSREYVFQRGAVLVDVDRAGAMCVVEGD